LQLKQTSGLDTITAGRLFGEILHERTNSLPSATPSASRKVGDTLSAGLSGDYFVSTCTALAIKEEEEETD
jgi:hypothetical protein